MESGTLGQPSSSFRFTLRTMFVVMALAAWSIVLFLRYLGCTGVFFVLLVLFAGRDYLRGNTKGVVGHLAVLAVFWLALQFVGPYTALRNRVIFVVGTQRLQQWAVSVLDHPPPPDQTGHIQLDAEDLPEDIRSLAGIYNVVLLSDDGADDRIMFAHGGGFYHWGIVVGRPGRNPSYYPLSYEKIADGIWGFRGG